MSSIMQKGQSAEREKEKRGVKWRWGPDCSTAPARAGERAPSFIPARLGSRVPGNSASLSLREFVALATRAAGANSGCFAHTQSVTRGGQGSSPEAKVEKLSKRKWRLERLDKLAIKKYFERHLSIELEFDF